jgi:transposase
MDSSSGEKSRHRAIPGPIKPSIASLYRLRPADAGTSEGALQMKKRRAKPASPPTGPTDSRLARRAVWLWLRPQARLTSAEQEAVLALCQAHPDLDLAYQLTQEFVTMLKQHQADLLADWIRRARGSHIPELVTFGRGLKRDEAAVLAGLELPYSQGEAPGHVNRLKLIKRMIVRARELSPPAPARVGCSVR